MSYQYNPVADLFDVDSALRDIGVDLNTELPAQPALLNAWQDYGSPYKAAGFYKTGLDIVYLEGMIMSGLVDSAAFQLPRGYRPIWPLKFPCVSNDSMGVILITSDGFIVPATPCSNLSVSLNGVMFRAEQ